MRRLASTLVVGGIASTDRTSGETVAHLVADHGGDVYELRGVEWLHAGMHVRIVVERCMDAGHDVGEEASR